MSGARTAAKSFRKRGFFNEGRAVGRMHFVRRGPKEKIDLFRAADFFIRRFWPRITRKIRAGLELQRVNKNAYDNFAVAARLLAREANERDVPGMQRAHRWNEHVLA